MEHFIEELVTKRLYIWIVHFIPLIGFFQVGVLTDFLNSFQWKNIIADFAHTFSYGCRLIIPFIYLKGDHEDIKSFN